MQGQNPFSEEQDEATGSGSTGLEASEGQEMVDTADGSCADEDLLACDSSTAPAPEAMSSEDASDERVTEDSEMCAGGDQEEYTDTRIIGDSVLEQ